MALNSNLNMSNELVNTLARIGKDWAQVHGICLRQKDNKRNSDIVQIAPFTLLPSPVPRHLYDEACSVQKDMNLLYHRVAFDYEFMKNSLVNVIKHDAFTRRLFEIYTDVLQKENRFRQPVVLTIQRADYMFDKFHDDVSLKQVEVNNIASGLAGLSSKITELHGEILRQLQHDDVKYNLPENRSLFTVAKGLVEAWKYYNNVNASVLFLVEEENQNIFDQRTIEYEMLQQSNSQARVIFVTFNQCYHRLSSNVDGKLIARSEFGDVEIAVVYFRVGYVPQHYKSENEWRARIMIEQSTAIKCPWIGAQLAGTKKVQQVLADPQILARFEPDVEMRRRIAETFVGLFSLDQTGENVEEIIEIASTNPEKYILKPQLEGGGNNFYGAEVRKQLKTLSVEERESYILMERIRSDTQNNILIRANQPPTLAEVVSELGTFGYVLGGADKVISNESGGHLLRTKPVGTDEGSVMTGASVIDSPYLV